MTKWKIEDEIINNSADETDERAVTMSTPNGINVLIPGRVYSDNSAYNKKFVFVGYGDVKYTTRTEEDRYVYIPLKNIENGIKKGWFSKDFEVLDACVYGSIFINSGKKPRVMLADHGELYPSSTFDKLVFCAITFKRKHCTKVAKIRGKQKTDESLLTKEEPTTMDTAVNIKKYVPEYKGLEVQVPGRVYKERNTEKLYIFLGYGDMEGIPVGKKHFGGYMYIEYNRYLKALKNGVINREISITTYNINDFLLYGLLFMKYPKILIEDVGKLFEEKYFTNAILNDGFVKAHIEAQEKK